MARTASCRGFAVLCYEVCYKLTMHANDDGVVKWSDKVGRVTVHASVGEAQYARGVQLGLLHC